MQQKAPVLIMSATVYLFGPPIDAHPDIVLTSLLYMKTSLGELGMPCANLSLDMQLYMIGQLVGSAFGGLTGIMSGKVRAMRTFRMVFAVLLQNFLQANENNFDDILAHIEDGRKYPPGRHWVNNILMPMPLAHQYLWAERERETGSSNSCALNVCYYTSSVRVTSIMLAISPGTCWRCGTFYLTLPVNV